MLFQIIMMDSIVTGVMDQSRYLHEKHWVVVLVGCMTLSVIGMFVNKVPGGFDNWVSFSDYGNFISVITVAFAAPFGKIIRNSIDFVHIKFPFTVSSRFRIIIQDLRMNVQNITKDYFYLCWRFLSYFVLAVRKMMKLFKFKSLIFHCCR